MQQNKNTNLKNKDHQRQNQNDPLENSSLNSYETQNNSLDDKENQYMNQLVVNKDAQKDRYSLYEKPFEDQLLNDILMQQRSSDLLFQELLNSLNDLKSTIKDKNEEQIVNIRIQQLSISKILVLSHQKTDFLLVVAHTHLGQAYLNFKFYEQAFGHLEIALKKIKKVSFSKTQQGKRSRNYNFYQKLGLSLLTYRSFIYTLLGKCQFQTQNITEALMFLQKARKDQEAKTMQDQIISTITLMYLSNCHTNLKDYKKGIDLIQKVLEIYKSHPNKNKIKIAQALIEKSKIYVYQNQIKKAQTTIQQAINIFNEDQIQHLEFIAQIFNILGGYQQKLLNKKGQQQSLKKRKNIFQKLYSASDQRVLKIRNQISHFYLKNGKYTQALDYFYQTLGLQQYAYGQESIQVANTLKSIGNIYKKTNQPQRAQQALMKSKAIFKNYKQYGNNRNIFKHSKDLKQKKEINKIKTLKEEKYIH